MLGYGLTGGVFGGGTQQARANGNPFVGNMTSGFMLPGNAPSSADTGQNSNGSSLFEDQVDSPFNGEGFGGSGEGATREPFTAAWRKQLASMSGRWFRRGRRNSGTPIPQANNMPAPLMGPLASSMQSVPMGTSSSNNPFMYF